MCICHYFCFFSCKHLSYHMQQKKKMKIFFFIKKNFFCLKNVQIKKLYENRGIAFFSSALFFFFPSFDRCMQKGHIFSNLLNLIRIKIGNTVSVCERECLHVYLLCDRNESVAINQLNLFEYYANYIGNLPFLR